MLIYYIKTEPIVVASSSLNESIDVNKQRWFDRLYLMRLDVKQPVRVQFKFPTSMHNKAPGPPADDSYQNGERVIKPKDEYRRAQGDLAAAAATMATTITTASIVASR